MDSRPPRLTRYAIAIVSVGLAYLIRRILDPFLGSNVAYATFIVGATFTAWYAGIGPSLLALSLGYVVGTRFFAAPRGPIFSADFPHLITAASYFFVGIATALFIAATRSARAAEKRERQRLSTTLLSIGDAVIVTDATGVVTMMNRVAMALIGWSETPRGAMIEDVFRIVNEHTRQPVENPVRRATREGMIVGLANQTVLLARDGHEIPVDDSASPIRTEDGDVIGAVLVFRDVRGRRRTEAALRESEARQKAIVETAVDGIITIDERGTIESINPAVTRIFGYSTDELVGRNISTLMPDPYRSEHDDYLARYRETGQRNIIGVGREVAGRRKDGSEFPLDLSVSETHLADRRIFTGMVRDITERKATERALREADQRKDEFLAILAHELRNPLAPIRNAAAVLQLKGPAQPDLVMARGIIERQVEQMARLLDDLLDISRITHQNVIIRKRRVALGEVIQRALETSRPAIDEAGHRLILEVSSEPLWVDADPLRLAQAISNLLTNAARYTDRKGSIWLNATREGSEIVVTVKDNGIGIAPNHLPRIFDMFAQAAPALERSQGGLGIGLSLVRAIAEMHDGRAEARSQGLGHGSEFALRLPAMVAPPAGAPPDQEDDSGPIAPMRILVADDNVDALETLGMLLRIAGHEVRLAPDGLAAVEMAEQLHPEVILLDIGMPKLNGYDAARRIRERPWSNGVMLAALTGWGQQEDRQRATEAGFDHHLVKPVEITAVERVLRLATARIGSAER